MIFYDVALRDFIMVAFFVNLCLMAKRRDIDEKKEPRPGFEPGICP